MDKETVSPSSTYLHLLQASLRLKDRPTYLRSLMRRDWKGRLVLPRCVASHLAEIDYYFPGALTEADRRAIGLLNSAQEQPEQ